MLLPGPTWLGYLLGLPAWATYPDYLPWLPTLATYPRIRLMAPVEIIDDSLLLSSDDELVPFKVELSNNTSSRAESMQSKPDSKKATPVVKHDRPKSAREVLETLPSPELPYTDTMRGQRAFGGSKSKKFRPEDLDKLGFEHALIPNCLQGLTFIFTGETSTYPRDDLAGMVKRLGGKVTSSVSGRTTCLVVGHEAGPAKIQKASDLGTKIITEDVFLTLMQEMVKPGYNVSVFGGQDEGDIDDSDEMKVDNDNGDDSFEILSVQDISGSKTKSDNTRPASKPVPKPNRSTEPAATKSDLWTTKYAPHKLSEICGNKGSVQSLKTWVNTWQKNNGPNTTANAKVKGNEFRAAMLSGPPGIGKTTAAHVIAQSEGYRVIEYNASDTRSKSLLNALVAPTLSNSAISKSGTDPILVILDEVDGMSAGDRGGVGAMAALCRKTSVPLILICNERNLPKMKPFDKCVFDIAFRKPDASACVNRIMQIAKLENFEFGESTAQALVEACGGDLRQVLNLLQHYRTSSVTMTSSEAKEAAKKWLKEQVLNPFDCVTRLFSNGSPGNEKLNLNQQMELYFNDYDLVPLLVAENYLPKTNSRQSLKSAEEASEAISLGDLVERKVRREQQWGLLPAHALLSTVIPAQVKAKDAVAESKGGFVRYFGLRFPTFLGNLSSGNRRRRELAELDAHMRLRLPLSVQSLRLDVLPLLCNLLLAPLARNDQDKTINLMDHYFITRDDLDVISDMILNEKIVIPTATKTAFTRKYNAMAHPLPFMRTAAAKTAAKQSEATPDTDDFVVKDEPEAEIKETTEEEQLQEAMKNDKYIKMKPKKAVRKTPVKRTAAGKKAPAKRVARKTK